MSLSWRNRIYLAFSPERISMLKLGRGLKPKQLSQCDEVISALADVNLCKSPPWQAALAKLAQILAQPDWANAEVDVVLSNHLIRYAAIPFSGQLRKYPEQEAFARHVLTQTYGAIAASWELRIQSSRIESPRVVSAVDNALLEGLRQVCTANKLKLRSVTPYLMPVFNSYCKMLKSDLAWLVINESGCSLFALLSRGEFVSVNVVKHDSIGELPMLLNRESLMLALTDPCKTVYLYAPTGGELSLRAQMGYEFNRLGLGTLEGSPSLGVGLYAMAMSGVL